MEPTVTTTRKAELEAVRIRRAELRESMTHLEYALAAPAGAQAAGWGERVHAVLIEMADDFAEHVDVTEGPGGLHQAILSGDLRLANAVNASNAAGLMLWSIQKPGPAQQFATEMCLKLNLGGCSTPML